MAESTNVQGAADKIKGLLNPEQGQSEPEKKAEPSEQPQEEVKKEVIDLCSSFPIYSN